MSLHVHYFKNGNIVGDPEYLHPGDELYEKQKKLFKTVSTQLIKQILTKPMN